MSASQEPEHWPGQHLPEARVVAPEHRRAARGLRHRWPSPGKLRHSYGGELSVRHGLLKGLLYTWNYAHGPQVQKADGFAQSRIGLKILQVTQTVMLCIDRLTASRLIRSVTGGLDTGKGTGSCGRLCHPAAGSCRSSHARRGRGSQLQTRLNRPSCSPPGSGITRCYPALCSRDAARRPRYRKGTRWRHSTRDWPQLHS